MQVPLSWINSSGLIVHAEPMQELLVLTTDCPVYFDCWPRLGISALYIKDPPSCKTAFWGTTFSGMRIARGILLCYCEKGMLLPGGFGYGSQATMTMALKRVKATAAMALSFIQMVWALILGFLVFSEVRLSSVRVIPKPHQNCLPLSMLQDVGWRNPAVHTGLRVLPHDHKTGLHRCSIYSKTL